MKTIYATLLLLLAACGHHGQDAELVPVIQTFAQEAQTRGIPVDTSVSVTFGEPDAGTMAQCKHVLADHWIVVSRDEWLRDSDARREEILFHELGHCVLGRPHLDDGTETLMTTKLVSEDVYEGARTTFIDELFQNRNQ